MHACIVQLSAMSAYTATTHIDEAAYNFGFRNTNFVFFRVRSLRGTGRQANGLTDRRTGDTRNVAYRGAEKAAAENSTRPKTHCRGGKRGTRMRAVLPGSRQGRRHTNSEK